MLKDEDRIFKNLYNDLGKDLISSQKRDSLAAYKGHQSTPTMPDKMTGQQPDFNRYMGRSAQAESSPARKSEQQPTAYTQPNYHELCYGDRFLTSPP